MRRKGQCAVPAPAGLDTRTGGHSDRWAAGSQQPAASSPGLPSARPALPSPPGWLRVWSRWNQRALPSFVCWCFLPFTARFLFSGLSGPGESRGQPDSQPSTLGSRQPGAQQTAPSLGQAAQPSNPPHLHLTPAAPAWQIAPLPAWGKPLRVFGFQSLLFRDWKTRGCVGYSEAPLLTLGGRKLRPGAGSAWRAWLPAQGSYQHTAACLLLLGNRKVKGSVS